MPTQDLRTNFDVEYELTRFLRQTRQYAMSRLAEIHPDLDYNSFLLLVAIADAGNGVRASGLAEILHVHKSTVSRAVSSLERLQLIERNTDPDDGRAQVLTVAPDARERLNAFRLKSHAWLADLLESWSDEDASSFGRMLGRLNDAVGRGYVGVFAAAFAMSETFEPFMSSIAWL